MSRYYYNPPPMTQTQAILFKESTYDQNGSSFSTQEINSSPDFIRKAYVNEEYDIEDEESEFKMGRLIRQASLNSSHMSDPQQTIKVMKGSSSFPPYLSQKPETNQEKVCNMRKFENTKERKRSKNSMKTGKNNGGAPTIPGGWVDKGSSIDMKEQIKFWARTVAFNLHQES